MDYEELVELAEMFGLPIDEMEDLLLEEGVEL